MITGSLSTFVEYLAKRAKSSLESKGDLRSVRVSSQLEADDGETPHLLLLTHEIFKYAKIKHASICCFKLIVKSIDFRTSF